jgi:hypothetical protein
MISSRQRDSLILLFTAFYLVMGAALARAEGTIILKIPIDIKNLAHDVSKIKVVCRIASIQNCSSNTCLYASQTMDIPVEDGALADTVTFEFPPATPYYPNDANYYRCSFTLLGPCSNPEYTCTSEKPPSNDPDKPEWTHYDEEAPFAQWVSGPIHTEGSATQAGDGFQVDSLPQE